MRPATCAASEHMRIVAAVRVGLEICTIFFRLAGICRRKPNLGNTSAWRDHAGQIKQKASPSVSLHIVIALP